MLVDSENSEIDGLIAANGLEAVARRTRCIVHQLNLVGMQEWKSIIHMQTCTTIIHYTIPDYQ